MRLIHTTRPGIPVTEAGRQIVLRAGAADLHYGMVENREVWQADGSSS